MKGKRVNTVEELHQLSLDRRSVIHAGKPIPAVVVLNMSGSLILAKIRHGLYIYEKTTPERSEKLGEELEI